jgi:hypothetical protein
MLLRFVVTSAGGARRSERFLFRSRRVFLCAGKPASITLAKEAKEEAKEKEADGHEHPR